MPLLAPTGNYRGSRRVVCGPESNTWCPMVPLGATWLLNFKSSVPCEQHGRWVRFPCAPAIYPAKTYDDGAVWGSFPEVQGFTKSGLTCDGTVLVLGRTR